MKTTRLGLATAKTIYRLAIDASAHDAEGEAWWREVATEVQAVVDAPDLAAAADIVAWWHNDWSVVGDTAARAARLVRTAAARTLSRH